MRAKSNFSYSSHVSSTWCLGIFNEVDARPTLKGWFVLAPSKSDPPISLTPSPMPFSRQSSEPLRWRATSHGGGLTCPFEYIFYNSDFVGVGGPEPIACWSMLILHRTTPRHFGHSTTSCRVTPVAPSPSESQRTAPCSVSGEQRPPRSPLLIGSRSVQYSTWAPGHLTLHKTLTRS